MFGLLLFYNAFYEISPLKKDVTIIIQNEKDATFPLKKCLYGCNFKLKWKLEICHNRKVGFVLLRVEYLLLLSLLHVEL